MSETTRTRINDLDQMAKELADARFRLRVMALEAETIANRLAEIEQKLNRQARAILDGAGEGGAE